MRQPPPILGHGIDSPQERSPSFQLVPLNILVLLIQWNVGGNIDHGITGDPIIVPRR